MGGYMVKMNVEKEESVSERDVNNVISLFSEKKAASAAQVSSVLGLKPATSLVVIGDLVDKGLIQGSLVSYSSAQLDDFYSLTAKGVRRAKLMREELK